MTVITNISRPTNRQFPSNLRPSWEPFAYVALVKSVGNGPQSVGFYFLRWVLLVACMLIVLSWCVCFLQNSSVCLTWPSEVLHKIGGLVLSRVHCSPTYCAQLTPWRTHRATTAWILTSPDRHASHSYCPFELLCPPRREAGWSSMKILEHQAPPWVWECLKFQITST